MSTKQPVKTEVDYRVEEFKNRLIQEVGKIITGADVMMNQDTFMEYVNKLTPEQRADLCYVLRGEILQLIFAVKEAK